MLTGQKHLRGGSGSYEQVRKTASLVLMVHPIFLWRQYGRPFRRDCRPQSLNNKNLIPEKLHQKFKECCPTIYVAKLKFHLKSLRSLPQMLRHWVPLKEVQDCTFKVLN